MKRGWGLYKQKEHTWSTFILHLVNRHSGWVGLTWRLCVVQFSLGDCKHDDFFFFAVVIFFPLRRSILPMCMFMFVYEKLTCLTAILRSEMNLLNHSFFKKKKKTEWLRTMENCLVIFLETDSLQSGCQQGHIPPATSRGGIFLCPSSVW